MHAATAMLGPQTNQHIARALSLVRDCRSLAGVREILSRAAGSNHPPQAAAYSLTMDVQTLAACQQALAYRAWLFEFTPKGHPLGSAEPSGQA
ncbi:MULTISPECIES: hypothetical protein [unclassified Bradyrhizobium]|uniref:hypothetical protein n=1 Tax=unclassified Bradyrhizobium TaxID=2631580 RepID=UPI002478B6AF|nr:MULTISPECIES: hypothetical protein [unclassified Bradyrhizobium]WGR72787.1 hypothetical protein MTX24_07735 [Bradyrhizobium sp. ISRA426]WGR77622.1 hypothetical protein MTX21_32690 [Bradyrhizobium sp. ISRA430]WGR88027.1 hypothetical protein MTX25_07740 [Bradyrhizobium sp. ISRA432]